MVVNETLERPRAVDAVAMPAAFYESVYADAAGDASKIPWSDGVANPALVAWLNAVAPRVVRCGSRVAVVGCGLGEDARAIIARGYDVTAFDCSPTAIAWAKELDPDHAACYQVADIFSTPSKWRHRFDLVVEIYTVQSLHPSRRADTLRAIGDLMGPHGSLLVIARGSEVPVNEADGPPWPLTVDELERAADDAGLSLAGSIDVFEDDENPPQLRLRGLLKHAS